MVTLLAFDVFLCFDIFFANGVGITCDGHKTWQIYTLISVDTMQCILLITVSILMYRKLIQKSKESVLLEASQRSVDPKNRFVYQMKILAMFYVVTTCLDWIMFLGGQAAVRNEDILCYDHKTLIINSNLGGTFMLADMIICYLYAFFMWYAFYQVPKQYGVVSRRSVDDVAMITDTSVIVHDEENLKAVVRELDNDRRFIRKQ